MTIDERTRHTLFLKLEEVLGPEEATTLMEHLPPVGWADVATKRDIDQLAVATKRDIDQLAVATKRDIDQLAESTKRDIDQLAVATKRDIDQLAESNATEHQELEATFRRVETTLRQDMDHLGDVLRGEMRELEHRLTATFRADILTQTRTMIFALVSTVITMGGLVIGLHLA